MNTTFASASDTAEQRPRTVELGPGVFGYVSEHDPNCGFVVGDEGVLVVDTRATPALGRELLAAVRAVTDKPVRHVFLTHYHAVRVFGTPAFEGAEVITSAGTAEWIETRGEADKASEIGRFPRLFRGQEEIGGLVRPDVVFEGALELRLGRRVVRLRHLGSGHSLGDAICEVPDCGVVFAGDLVENRCAVYTGDAYMQEWTGTLERLRGLKAPCMVPGRGAPMMDRRGVEDAIDLTTDFLVSLLDAVGQGMRAGEALRDIHARVGRLLGPRFGHWPVYQHAIAFDVSRAHDELRGLRHPVVWTAARDKALWEELHAS